MSKHARIERGHNLENDILQAGNGQSVVVDSNFDRPESWEPPFFDWMLDAIGRSALDACDFEW